MNPHLLIATVGVFYILVFGGLSILRREGLSTQFALEVLGMTALAVTGSMLTDTSINPILFLIFIYLVSMRARLMIDVANLLSARGYQRHAINLLQLALDLFPDRTTRLMIWVNMGIVQLRRQSPESAQALLEMALEQGARGGLGTRHEAAAHYNLGLALQRQGKEVEAVRHFNAVIEASPNSVFSKGAEQALAQRRLGKVEPGDPPKG
jgi:tetratricopeptide (TPR) repeat protein